jgi:hypothetical protein
MEWSRDEMTTLKMSVSCGDWAEEIASMLSKDVAEVRQKAEALGLTIKSFTAPQSPMPRASLIERVIVKHGFE